MAVKKNQFTAKIRFDPFAWHAYDEETRMYCTVVQSKTHATWTVFSSGKVYDHGTSTTTSAARSRCRQIIETYRKFGLWKGMKPRIKKR